MLGYLVKYSEFFGVHAPEDPLDLIRDIPKEELIVTIAGINAKLKPLTSVKPDQSRETQIESLRLIFMDDKRPISESVCISLIRHYLAMPANYNLFSRVTCLHAIQEIINSDDFTEQVPQYTYMNRENIFRFLLISNEQILTGDKNYKEEGYNELGRDFFEFFGFRELHHNQYNETSNFFNVLYKSFYLFDKIEGDYFYGQHFRNFLTWTYNVESTNEFLKHLLGSTIASNDEKLGLRYLNVSKDNTDAVKILDAFSLRENETYPRGDLRIFDFLPLKKAPLFKCSEKDDKDIISYVVIDEGFYIEKSYSLFINDFWFKYLLPNNIKNRKEWGGFIGSSFFEPFIEEILKESFSKTPTIILRSSSELLFNIEGRPIEYADFYIRNKQKVALLEVKSGFIPLDTGYKTVSTIEDYRLLDLNNFNKNYGITQLAEKTVKKFHLYKKEINDPSFSTERKVQIYPVLVVNDPIISSGIFPFVLKRKFNDLLAKEGISKKEKRHLITDLCIINVAHLQEMEENLKNKKVDFFALLDLYLQMSDSGNKANYKGYRFLRNFDHVLNVKLKNNLISARVLDYFLKENRFVSTKN
jgi:hypothetical protein